MEPHRFSNSRCTRRAFVLSLDALLAIVLAAAIVLVGAQFARQEPSDAIQLGLGQTGRSVAAVLEREGTLDTLDASQLRSRIDDLLPASHVMRVQLTCQSADAVSTNETLPTRRFIATGKRHFVVTSGGSVTDRCVARWWVWNA